MLCRVPQTPLFNPGGEERGLLRCERPNPLSNKGFIVATTTQSILQHKALVVAAAIALLLAAAFAALALSHAFTDPVGVEKATISEPGFEDMLRGNTEPRDDGAHLKSHIDIW